MKYEILVLDLDGTLTTSEKKVTPATKEALIKIQENGKKVVLASGRPTQGVLPLAKELELDRYGSYILSYNGARITDCRTQKLLFNKTVPDGILPGLYDIVKKYPVDLITYTDDKILSGLTPNEYTDLESRINHMPVTLADDFVKAVDYPVNKFLVTGDPKLITVLKTELTAKYHSFLNIYCSDPFFLEIMPQSIDKAYSLQKLLNSIGLTSDQMICCGDGYNDITMIEFAGLGVAMENAQPLVLESADYITRSNNEEGVLHVIEKFMLND